MMSEFYKVLYTHQKNKKQGVIWKDGMAEVNIQEKKLVLKDEDSTFVSSYRLKASDVIEVGGSIDIGKFLVAVDEAISTSATKTTLEQPTPQPKQILPRMPKFKGRGTFITPFSKKIKPSPATLNEAAEDPLPDSLPETSNTNPPREKVGTSPRPVSLPIESQKTSRIVLKKSFILPKKALHPAISTRNLEIKYPEKSSLSNENVVVRKQEIPLKFASWSAYQSTAESVLNEQLQVLINEHAIKYSSKVLKFNNASNIERSAYANGILLYTDCSIKKIRPFSGPNTSTENLNDISLSLFSVLLTLNQKHPSSFYNKDDTWAISSNISFDAKNTFVARSNYFGPDSESSLSVTPVNKYNQMIASNLLLSANPVVAKICIVSPIEWSILDDLKCNKNNENELSEIFKWILGTNLPTKQPVESSGLFALPQNDMGTRAKEIINKLSARYNLNPDQKLLFSDIMLKVCAIYSESGTELGSSSGINPISLVHGPFGTGKSLVICVIIIGLFILKTEFYDLNAEIRKLKVAVCSMTNAAVDRLLKLLLGLRFLNFVRIGNLDRVSKKIARFIYKQNSVSNYDIESENEHEHEHEEERGKGREEHRDDIDEGYDKDFLKTETKLWYNLRARDVETAFVVGTTIASAINPALQGFDFPLVFIDEAGQVTEYTTLVPLIRFNTRILVMVGDPKQLPPTITTKSTYMASASGIGRTLYDRMELINHKPIFLSTQYRCHPSISKLLNRLFYNQRILDGISPEDRPPVVPELPAICLVDIYDGMEVQRPRSISFHNVKEIEVCMKLVYYFVNTLKTDPNEIGVIALYKDQANILNERLEKIDSLRSVVVSTVDAFQGSEKKIVILSTIRTNSVGFLNNQSRINVALSRAKNHSIILGNELLLNKSKLWKQVVEYCKEGNTFFGALYLFKAIGLKEKQTLVSEFYGPESGSTAKGATATITTSDRGSFSGNGGNLHLKASRNRNLIVSKQEIIGTGLTPNRQIETETETEPELELESKIGLGLGLEIKRGNVSNENNLESDDQLDLAGDMDSITENHGGKTRELYPESINPRPFAREPLFDGSVSLLEDKHKHKHNDIDIDIDKCENSDAEIDGDGDEYEGFGSERLISSQDHSLNLEFDMGDLF